MCGVPLEDTYLGGYAIDELLRVSKMRVVIVATNIHHDQHYTNIYVSKAASSSTRG
jgi:hypothetical protein